MKLMRTTDDYITGSTMYFILDFIRKRLIGPHSLPLAQATRTHSNLLLQSPDFRHRVTGIGDGLFNQ